MFSGQQNHTGVIEELAARERKTIETDITVGVVVCNSAGYIRELLTSLLNSSIQPDRILIFNNASCDKTIDIVNGFCEQRIQVLQVEKNLGHSYGVNALIDHTRTRYLAVLDHDVTVENDCIEKMLRRARLFGPDDAAVSATIQSMKHDNRLTYGADCHYLVSSLHRFTFVTEIAGILPTTCVLLDLEKLGDVRFDDHFFIYNNDLDFFYRLRLRGMHLFVEPEARCRHKEGSSEISGRRNQSYTAKRNYYNARNRLLFYFKNYSCRTLLVLSVPLALFELLALVFSLRKGIMLSQFRAYVDFLHSIPGYIQVRRIIQASRTVKDRECLDVGDLQLAGSAVTSRLDRIVYRACNWCFKESFVLLRRFM